MANDTAERAEVRALPFHFGSRERNEPFHDNTVTMTAASKQVGPEDVLAHGFLRHLLIYVTLTGGVDGEAGVVAAGDAPFSAIERITLSDVNGNPIVNLTGYQAMLANKYGAYVFASDPRQSPAFSSVDADGNATFVLRVPVEISGRDALGALANQNASATYKLSYTVAGSADVYTTAPDTLPDVRVRAALESWTQPQATDLFGQAIEAKPPAHGTLQQWSSYPVNVNSGAQTVKFSRVGNYLRTVVLIARNASGVRNAAMFPDEVQLTYDGNVLDNILEPLLRHRIAERYGLPETIDTAGGLDTGVYVYDWSHDLDGHPGHEMRSGYLPTTQGTDLSLRGEFDAAGTLTILTNDVAPAGPIVAV